MSLAPLVVTITADTSKVEAAMRRLTESLARIDFSGAMRKFEAFANSLRKQPYDVHHPRPLTFHGKPFGAEYARRRRGRSR